MVTAVLLNKVDWALISGPENKWLSTAYTCHITDIFPLQNTVHKGCWEHSLACANPKICFSIV